MHYQRPQIIQRRIEILRRYFANNPKIKRAREQALTQGLPFTFDMTPELLRELAEAEIMLDC